MAETSKIEWTDATWNPVTGCSKVSPGCAHCYAETLSLRYGWTKKPWTPANAAENVVLRPDRLEQPLRWRQPRMVFVNSMSDLFHELVPIEFIARVFNVMACATLDCGHRRWDQHEEECWTGESHIFQVLTKRPERAKEIIEELPNHVAERWRGDSPISVAMEVGAWPLPNVWLGTSIENMRWVGRADVLRETPAAVRFISAEPLLGPLAEKMFCGTCWDGLPNCPDCEGLRWWFTQESLDLTDIDWLIVGGESGPTHRPMEADWARDLRDMCECAGTAFFFKQWGGRTPKAGGRELDGRTWDEFPRSAA